MAVIVGRAINGITLNGREYLLDQDGEPMKFSDEVQAISFLTERGCTVGGVEFFEVDGGEDS